MLFFIVTFPNGLRKMHFGECKCSSAAVSLLNVGFTVSLPLDATKKSTA